MVLGTMDRPPEGTAWKAVFALKGKHISFCVNWVSWTCLHSWCCLWRKKKQKKERMSDEKGGVGRMFVFHTGYPGKTSFTR